MTAITARMIEQAGFSAVYMTGAGTSASLGFPDYGLLSMTEMVDNAARIARSVSLPLIADADTGYGNELNVVRTVQETRARRKPPGSISRTRSRRSAAAIWTARNWCRWNDYLAKIRAAVASRRDPDFVIIARTDARSVLGLDEAIARANAPWPPGRMWPSWNHRRRWRRCRPCPAGSTGRAC